jgi:flagellar assembly protein FliH
LSKLIKSDQCIEADPCRLEPIDVDAFFINDEFSESQTETTSGDPAIIPDETRAGAGENGAVAEPAFASGEPVDISRIADLAEQLKAFIGGNQEPASTAEDVEEPEDSKADDMADFKELTAKAQQEAEQIFSGAKSRADELTHRAKNQAEELDRNARNQAEELTKNAKYLAEETAHNAQAQAKSILEGAQSKFHELTEGAKQQAGSILEGAKQQAGNITDGASREAERIFTEARQKAAFITESASREAAELLERMRQQHDETMKNAEQEAAGLLETAKRQVAEMLAQAEAQGVEIKNQAQQEGFKAGHAEGLAKAQQEYEKKLADALVIVAQSEAARLERIQSSEAELLKLAVAIAEKIIGAELKTDPGVQVAIVKEALTGISTAGSLTIKVNPEDYRFIEENLAEFQKAFREPVPVKLQRDQGIAVSNCYIETDHGNIDARIKTQLEMIMAEILKVGRPECF